MDRAAGAEDGCGYGAGKVTTFLMFSGIGDHVLWLSHLRGYRERYGQTSVQCSFSMLDLTMLFRDSYDDLTVVDYLEGYIQDLMVLRARPDNEPVLAWHPRWIGDEVAYLKHHGGTMADAMCDILRLPHGTQMAKPEWPSTATVKAKRRMVDARLPEGRTVLLAPSTHTMPPVHDPWWRDLVAYLTWRGLSVAMNVANRGRGFDHSRHPPVLDTLPGTIPVDVPLSEIGPFATLCGYAICARAGLADLLARVQTRLCVVWPANPADERLTFLSAIWSVREVYKAPDVTEIRVPMAAEFDPEQLEGWLDG
jgi:hypothetical protein